MPTKSSKQKRSLPSNRAQKRWFVGFSGWGLDLNAGSGDPSTKTKRDAMPLSTESKIISNETSVLAASFLHNTIYTCGVNYSIVEGTDFFNRLGTHIHLEATTLNYTIDTSYAVAPNNPVLMRVMLVANTYQSAQIAFGSGLGSSNLFYSFSDGLSAIVDPTICKVLVDEVIKVQPTITAAGGVVTGSFLYKTNSQFEYRSSTNYGTAANLYWLVIPYVAHGTNGVTTCGNINFNVTTAFKDK